MPDASNILNGSRPETKVVIATLLDLLQVLTNQEIDALDDSTVKNRFKVDFS